MATEKRLIRLDHALQSVSENYRSDMPKHELDMLVATRKRLKAMPTVDAIFLPCKIGDKVYAIRNYKGFPAVQEGIVSEMLFTSDMQLCICVKSVCRGEWGKKIFATREEAEAAIGGKMK